MNVGRTGEGGEAWNELNELKGERCCRPNDELLSDSEAAPPPMSRVRLEAKSRTSWEVFSSDRLNVSGELDCAWRRTRAGARGCVVDM